MAVGADIIVDLSDNDDDDCVLEAVIYNSKNDKQKINVNCDHIFKENPLLAEVIEKCLNLENTGGMYRVLYKTLLGIYKEVNPEFKLSSDFQTVLKRTLIKLDKDPGHKFSHIKELCEALRSSKFKKHAQLTTLESKKQLNKRESLSLKRKNKCNRRSKKRKHDIIDLDHYEEIPTINLDQNDTDNDCPIIIDDEKENQISEGNNNSNTETNADRNLHDNQNENHPNKENSEKVMDTSTNHENHTEKIQENNICFPEENVDQILVSSLEEDDNIPDSPLKLLQVQSVSTIDLSMEEEPLSEKIKSIEQEIASCKQEIATLDEEEVIVDTIWSPYIRSEKLKEKIVSLYKELCTLTGTDATKRREVTLTVTEGHPSGPVKRLEKFLNRNIGSDGNPPFPDFSDVVKCVDKANVKDNLGWSKVQVMREATALFTHCGRALQKRRQRREWSDLLSRVKAEQCDDDPADRDLELQARLEANRRVAFQKETDLLERYSMLQNLPPVRAHTITNGDKSLNENKSMQLDLHKETITATTKDVNSLDSNEIVIVNSTSNSKETTNNLLYTNNCIIQTTLVMPTIIAESITNKGFTDEFGLKVFEQATPHVVVCNVGLNVTNADLLNATNAGLNFVSNVVENNLQCNFSNIPVESNVGNNMFQSNSPITSHIESVSFEPDVESTVYNGQVNDKLESNSAELPVEYNVGNNMFQSNSPITSHIESVSFEPDVESTVYNGQVNDKLQSNSAELPVESNVGNNMFQSNSPITSHIESVSFEPDVESTVYTGQVNDKLQCHSAELPVESNVRNNMFQSNAPITSHIESVSFEPDVESTVYTGRVNDKLKSNGAEHVEINSGDILQNNATINSHIESVSFETIDASMVTSGERNRKVQSNIAKLSVGDNRTNIENFKSRIERLKFEPNDECEVDYNHQCNVAKLGDASLGGDKTIQPNAANFESIGDKLGIEPGVKFSVNGGQTNNDLQGTDTNRYTAVNFKSHIVRLKFEPNDECEVDYKNQCNVAKLGDASPGGDKTIQPNAANFESIGDKLGIEPGVRFSVNGGQTNNDLQGTDTNKSTAVNFKSHIERLKFEPNVECNLNAGEIKLESTEEMPSYATVKKESDNVYIKPDPSQNVASLLNNFGDIYTVSVFDICDPFLVVDISDSSDDED